MIHSHKHAVNEVIPLVITSPTHDVLPIIWTDYTYDSEHGIAEVVPLAFSDAASRSLGEQWLNT